MDLFEAPDEAVAAKVVTIFRSYATCRPRVSCPTWGVAAAGVDLLQLCGNAHMSGATWQCSCNDRVRGQGRP